MKEALQEALQKGSEVFLGYRRLMHLQEVSNTTSVSLNEDFVPNVLKV